MVNLLQLLTIRYMSSRTLLKLTRLWIAPLFLHVATTLVKCRGLSLVGGRWCAVEYMCGQLLGVISDIPA